MHEGHPRILLTEYSDILILVFIVLEKGTSHKRTTVHEYEPRIHDLGSMVFVFLNC